MNKKEFLEKLRRKLVILNSEEIEDIIVEYGGYIDEKVKKGKTEEQAIKEFGDINELVKEILSAYKINDNSPTFKNTVMNFFDDIGKMFSNFANDIDSNNPKDLIKFGVEILVLIIIIGIFRLPLELLIHLGKDIFSVLPNTLYVLIYGLWRFILELAYLVLAVIFFLKVFKERYSSYNFGKTKEVKPKKSPAKTESKIIVEKKVTSTKVVKEKPTPPPVVKDNSDSTASLVLKIIAAFFLIPGIATSIGLIIAFGLGVGLIISGVHYFGVIICLFALLQFSLIFVEVLFNFIFGGRVSSLKLYGSLILGIVALGVGVTFTVFEVVNTTIIDTIPSGFEQKEISKEFNSNEIDYLSTWYNEDIEYYLDESLGNTIIVKIEYYEEFIEPNIRISGKTLRINGKDAKLLASKEIYKSVVNNLKNKEIYNYIELFKYKITISGNNESLSKLRG